MGKTYEYMPVDPKRRMSERARKATTAIQGYLNMSGQDIVLYQRQCSRFPTSRIVIPSVGELGKMTDIPREVCGEWQPLGLTITHHVTTMEPINECAFLVRFYLKSCRYLIVSAEFLGWIGPHLLRHEKLQVVTPETHPEYLERDQQGRVIGIRAFRRYKEPDGIFPWD